jgi:hypothetical protein
MLIPNILLPGRVVFRPLDGPPEACRLSDSEHGSFPDLARPGGPVHPAIFPISTVALLSLFLQ